MAEEGTVSETRETRAEPFPVSPMGAAYRLLGIATRRPWRVEDRGWSDASQTIRCGDGDTDGFGHHSEANAALIVAAVNEYEAHIALEAAVRRYRVKLDDDSAFKMGAALSRLDEMRGE